MGLHRGRLRVSERRPVHAAWTADTQWEAARITMDTTDHDAAAAFAAIPGAQLFHLSQNEHEPTFAVLDAG